MVFCFSGCSDQCNEFWINESSGTSEDEQTLMMEYRGYRTNGPRVCGVQLPVLSVEFKVPKGWSHNSFTRSRHERDGLDRVDDGSITAPNGESISVTVRIRGDAHALCVNDESIEFNVPGSIVVHFSDNGSIELNHSVPEKTK